MKCAIVYYTPNAGNLDKHMIVAIRFNENFNPVQGDMCVKREFDTEDEMMAFVEEEGIIWDKEEEENGD